MKVHLLGGALALAFCTAAAQAAGPVGYGAATTGCGSSQTARKTCVTVSR